MSITDDSNAEKNRTIPINLLGAKMEIPAKNGKEKS
jgi:hypothetical protein